MVLKNITDIDRFFEVVGKCKDRVQLVSAEGDRINLKSRLCQYIAIAKIFSDGTLDDLQIEVPNPDDLAKLIEYMILG